MSPPDLKEPYPPHLREGWRDYQARLNRQRRQRRLIKQAPKYLLVVVVLVAVGYGLFLWPNGTDATLQPEYSTTTASLKAPAQTVPQFTGQEVSDLLRGTNLGRLNQDVFTISAAEQSYQVKTFLDSTLQDYLLANLDLAHSEYIGIVALEPRTGHILAMVSYDKHQPDQNACTRGSFPAASIFKIVSAAAAIETIPLEAASKLTYNGRKHTLYKSQLKDQQNRYTRWITFEKSFAESINPVFGKLGVHHLKRKGLEQYALAFGFNDAISFEAMVDNSVMVVSDDPFNWAEVSSGFNRQTTLSPLHAALIGAVVLNQGRMPEPVLVANITDGDGHKVYQGRSREMRRCVDPATARILRQMMTATVRSGTARKAFRGYRKDKVLSKLVLGGKTGTINNDPRYDWFVGFGDHTSVGTQMAVAVVVAHKEFIGRRAGQYARMALKKYFGDRPQQTVAPGNKGAS